jgi:hypothetical protein
MGSGEDSSRGVVKVRPSIGICAWCPLRASSLLRRAAFRPVRKNLLVGASSPSVRSCHPPNSFRPCRSSRLRRLAPPSAFQVCCTLKPIMGFATFQAFGAWSRSYPYLRVLSQLSGKAQLALPCGRARWSGPGSASSTPRSRCRGSPGAGCFPSPSAIPCGVPPFGAFPSMVAVPRHPVVWPHSPRRPGPGNLESS